MNCPDCNAPMKKTDCAHVCQRCRRVICSFCHEEHHCKTEEKPKPYAWIADVLIVVVFMVLYYGLMSVSCYIR